MATIEAVLRGALEPRQGQWRLTLDPAFQGLPDTAHGGTVLAVFHALAGRPGHCVVHAAYRRRVPLGTPLRLTTEARGDGLACTLVDGADTGTVLADGAVGVERTASDHAAVAALDGAPPRPDPRRSSPLPISRTCFACGTENPLGLGVQLHFDQAAVGGAWVPRETFVTADGDVAPIALTALLDETAFWLGALASGESGMTTALAVRLHGPVKCGTIHVAGRRDAVRRRAADGRYWEAAVRAWTDDDRPAAEATVRFAAVRGAARRLVKGMLNINPAEIVRRVFPAYVD